MRGMPRPPDRPTARGRGRPSPVRAAPGLSPPARELTATPAPAAALTHLRRDPVLRAVLSRVAGMRTAYRGGDDFVALTRIIIGQQLSMRAAATIWARAAALVPAWTPAAVAALSRTALRSAGLSQAKITTLHALAGRLRAGALDLARLRTASDAEVTAALRTVPGCGPWTIAMFLLFAHERPDVFSAGDGGLRRAICHLYRLPPDADDRHVERIAAAWSPWRSVACRYLWAWLDLAPPRPRRPGAQRPAVPPAEGRRRGKPRSNPPGHR